MPTKQYSIWIINMDGDENTLTARLTENQSIDLHRKLWKLQKEQILSDSHVTTINDCTYQEAIDEINNWFENQSIEARI